MSRRHNYHLEPKYLRDTLRRANKIADDLHAIESTLVTILREIDLDRIFVRFGYKSLRTYVVRDLKFTKVQAQRLVTLARRNSTMVDIGQKAHDDIKGDEYTGIIFAPDKK